MVLTATSRAVQTPGSLILVNVRGVGRSSHQNMRTRRVVTIAATSVTDRRISWE